MLGGMPMHVMDVGSRRSSRLAESAGQVNGKPRLLCIRASTTWNKTRPPQSTPQTAAGIASSCKRVVSSIGVGFKSPFIDGRNYFFFSQIFSLLVHTILVSASQDRKRRFPEGISDCYSNVCPSINESAVPILLAHPYTSRCLPSEVADFRFPKVRRCLNSRFHERIKI